MLSYFWFLIFGLFLQQFVFNDNSNHVVTTVRKFGSQAAANNKKHKDNNNRKWHTINNTKPSKKAELSLSKPC